MPATVTFNGFKEFQLKVKHLNKELMEEFEEECKEAANHWAELAIEDAPIYQGFLHNQINPKKVEGEDMAWEVASNAEYSAFVEWGTRKKAAVHVATLSPELQQYAATFRGKGVRSDVDVKQLIYEWCRFKGIPEEYWGLVFFRLMTVGMNPHPFFFIQFPIIEKEFYTNLAKIVTTEH